MLCLGIQEEFHPLMCQVKGRETSVSAEDPEVAHELARAPHSCSWEPSEDTKFKQSPMDKKPLWESWSPGEIVQHATGAKIKSKLGPKEEGKRDSWT